MREITTMTPKEKEEHCVLTQLVVIDLQLPHDKKFEKLSDEKKTTNC